MRFPERQKAVFLPRQNDKWITVHPNGSDAKGRPALIDSEGIVKGGMGGKFNGKNIKDARKGASDSSSVSGSGSGANTPEKDSKSDTGNVKSADSSAGKISESQKLEMDEAGEKYVNSAIEYYRQREKGEKKYLSVPYSEKDSAKAAGARWDPGEKKWYIPQGQEIPESMMKYSSDPRSVISRLRETVKKSDSELELTAKMRGMVNIDDKPKSHNTQHLVLYMRKKGLGEKAMLSKLVELNFGKKS